MTHRVIARLDIKGPNLVKGIEYEGLRVLGKPEVFARRYYNSRADELIYMDVVASLYERNSLLNIIQKTAAEIFIPLTVGGGLRSITDMREALRAGADKVAINTAAIRNPKLISDAAQVFGSSAVVAALECKRHPNGTFEAYIDNGRERTGKDAIAWAKETERLGAGEILLISVDNDGTFRGFDIELVKRVSEKVTIPLIAGGGAGKESDISSVIEAGSQAVAIASILHYKRSSIKRIKSALIKKGVAVRS